MRIARRVKTVIPAEPGIRMVGFNWHRGWNIETIDELPAETILWSDSVQLWTIYVNCYRDAQDGYTEEVDVKAIPLYEMWEGDADNVLGYSRQSHEEISCDASWLSEARRRIKQEVHNAKRNKPAV